MLPTSTNSNYICSSGDLHALRRFLRVREPARGSQEHCQMCNAPVAPTHRHMLDLANHGILCACEACALLFASKGAGQDRYHLIPRRVLALQDFQMTDEQWDEQMLPVNMLYIFRSTEARRVLAFYPSPAGAMESLLNLNSWETLRRANPILNEMEPDVEALLINRIEQTRAYYLVPIDVCYRLVGLLRISWKGLSGGPETWENIANFFAELQAQATPASVLAGAQTYQREPSQQIERVAEQRKGGDNAHTGPEL